LYTPPPSDRRALPKGGLLSHIGTTRSNVKNSKEETFLTF
jgi:hypothetical protein